MAIEVVCEVCGGRTPSKHSTLQIATITWYSQGREGVREHSAHICNDCREHMMALWKGHRELRQDREERARLDETVARRSARPPFLDLEQTWFPPEGGVS